MVATPSIWDAPFNISERSAGISSLQPEPVAAAGLDAVAAVPDGRSAARAAAAVARPPWAVEAALASRPVEALASLSAEPDAAVVAVRPSAVARLAELAAVLEPSAWPAEWALKAPQRVWVAAVVPRLAFAPFPERLVLHQGPEPIRRLSADQRQVPVHSFPALSDHPRVPADSGQPLPEASSEVDLAGQVSR